MIAFFKWYSHTFSYVHTGCLVLVFFSGPTALAYVKRNQVQTSKRCAFKAHLQVKQWHGHSSSCQLK